VCERTSFDGGYIGINSYGIGGSNVHVLLRSPDRMETSRTTHVATTATRLVTCAGRTKDGVEATLAEVSQHPTDIDMQCMLQGSAGDVSPMTHPYRGAALVNAADSRQIVEVQIAVCILCVFLNSPSHFLSISPFNDLCPVGCEHRRPSQDVLVTRYPKI